MKTLLLIIDMQNDFCKVNGALDSKQKELDNYSLPSNYRMMKEGRSATLKKLNYVNVF